MSCRTVDPIRLRIITSNPAQIVRGSDSYFQSFVDQLRIELDPTTLMEALLVEQIILGVTRMRQAARQETANSSCDPKWLRFQSMAERGFWKALNTFEKHRRQAARAAKAEAKAAPQSIPQPQPAPTPISSTPPPSQPAPPPAPRSQPEPTRPNPKRPSFAELAAILDDGPTVLDLTITPPSLLLAAAS